MGPCNLSQQGSAVRIELVLPVIKAEKIDFLFLWLIKHQSGLYLENCIHEKILERNAELPGNW